MTKNTLFKKGIIGAALATTMFVPMFAFAQAQNDIKRNEILPPSIGTELGQGDQDLRVTIAKMIRTAMSLLGIIAVLIILYGGFKWMTSQGSEDAVGEAKKIIIAGIIGLVIILTAYAIATFVINGLIDATRS